MQGHSVYQAANALNSRCVMSGSVSDKDPSRTHIYYDDGEVKGEWWDGWSERRVGFIENTARRHRRGG